MKEALSILLFFALSHLVSFSAEGDATFKVNRSSFHISTDSTKITLENVGSKTAQAMLKSFWTLNKKDPIVVRNDYFLDRDEMMKPLLKKINPDGVDVSVAELTLRFNETNQNYELYTTLEGLLLLKSKSMDDILNRAFEIQYPNGYEERRIKKTKTQ